MRLLALDPGSHLGWCWGDVGSTPRFGVYRTPGKDEGAGMRFVAMERFIMTLIVENECDRVYFEEPFLDHGTGGSWQNAPPRSFKSEALRWGFPAVIAMACTKQGVEAFPVAVGTWRSSIGAPTRAPKTVHGTDARRSWVKMMTLERVRRLGYEPASQDEADALGIWLAMTGRIERKASQPDLFGSATR